MVKLKSSIVADTAEPTGTNLCILPVKLTAVGPLLFIFAVANIFQISILCGFEPLVFSINENV